MARNRMMDFVIPLTPEGLITSDSVNRYCIENTFDISPLSDKELAKKINIISGKLDSNASSITQPENFDFLYTCMTEFSSLSISSKSTLIVGLENGLKGMQKLSSSLLKQSPDNLRQTLPTYRNAFKMYLYLIHWFVSKEEQSSSSSSGSTAARGKKKKTENTDKVWSSDSQKETLVAVLVNCLESELHRIWNNSKPEEDFLNLFSKIGRIMIESPSNMRTKSLKRSIFTMMGILIHRYDQSQTVSACIMELLFKLEHVANAGAEFLEQFVKDFKNPQIIADFLREISRMESSMNKDASGTKNISAFIVSLSELLPKELVPNVSLLIPLLANDSYMLRNGVVQSLGNIICVCSGKEDDKENEKENTKNRDQYIVILEERVLDVAAYTRSKTLQTLISIVQQKFLPLKFISSTTEAAIGRLEDRTTQVRKYSIQLLTQILLFNPFSASLKLSEFCSQLSLVEQQIKDYISTKPKKEKNEDDEDEEEEVDDKLKKLNRQKKFFEDGISFINKLHQCVPLLVKLLGSKTTTDIQESIDFFVAANDFKLEAANEGVKKMLSLVYSKEATIKEAVINAYKQLYLVAPSQYDPKLGDIFIASNLVKLATGATTTELTCLEELVSILTSKQLIPSGSFKCLWDFFAMKVPNITESQSKSALIILSMAAKSNPEIVKEKLKLLVTIGLGPRYKRDEEIAKYTCLALQKLCVINEEGEKKIRSKRYPPTHSLFYRLASVIKEESNSTSKWFPAAEQAINAIYMLAENPDSICTPIIKFLAHIVFTKYEDKSVSSPKARIQKIINKKDVNDSDSDDESENEMEEEGEVEEEEKGEREGERVGCSSNLLARFLFVVGHVALKHMQYLEEIQSELARRKNLLENTNQNDKKTKKDKEPTLEEELGVGSVADDTDEFIQMITEKEIVQKNLLGSFSNLIISVCKNDRNQFQSHLLRSSAVIALCKFMCVSTEFCENHLRLLFTLLTKAVEPWIRSDIVIALGDLVSRFPNQIDVWIPKIFSTLRDKEPSVRKNALMVLSHSILNEMVKVKGYISEIALCIEDTDERISDLAKLFFNEFNNKDGGNIYNVLPDMISNLSVSGCTSDSFRNIMKYILAFIDKEKQTESLIDRLCQQRLRAATDENQVADIAYCMSLLNYSEKGFKKIAENFKFYQDKLMNESVYSSFIQIIQKAKKNSKPEMKVEIEDLENKINAQHQGLVNEADPMPTDEENLNPQFSSKSKAPVKKRGGRPPAKTTKTTAKAPAKTTTAAKKKPPVRATRTAKRKVAYASDEEDDDFLSDD